jgi:hypothetical protein
MTAPLPEEGMLNVFGPNCREAPLPRVMLPVAPTEVRAERFSTVPAPMTVRSTPVKLARAPAFAEPPLVT